MTCAVRNCPNEATEEREVMGRHRPGDGIYVAVFLRYCPEHYVRALAFKASGGRWAA